MEVCGLQTQTATVQFFSNKKVINQNQYHMQKKLILSTITTAFLLTQVAIAGNTTGNGAPRLEIQGETADTTQPIANGPTSRMPLGRCGSRIEELIIGQLTWGPAVFDATYDEEPPTRTGMYVNEGGDTVIRIKMPSSFTAETLPGPIREECTTRKSLPWEEGYDFLGYEFAPESAVEEDTAMIGEAAYAVIPGKISFFESISFSTYSVNEDLPYIFHELSCGGGLMMGQWRWWLDANLGHIRTNPERFNRKESAYYWSARVGSSFDLTPNFLGKNAMKLSPYTALSAAKVFGRKTNEAMDLGPNQRFMNWLITVEVGCTIRWRKIQFGPFLSLWPYDEGSYELATRGSLGEGAPTGDLKNGGWGIGFRAGFIF